MNYLGRAPDEAEGIECFHIGDIFARTSDADGRTDEEASTTPAAGHNQNRKKKLIYVGASVIAISIATATGVLVSRQNSAQKSVAAVSLTEEAAENPWYACLDKESCFRQANKLGFADEDHISGDYSSRNLYGCFIEGLQAKWGEGGTEEQMATPGFTGGQLRIWCYDVNPNPHEEVDICGNPIPNLPSGRPSFTPSTSFRPSMSSQPSPIPTSSLRPSISAAPSASPSSKPSASPTTSSEPSTSPSISVQPSISFRPSNMPSKSADPSTSPSGQPSLNPTR